jgi:hypothetical protein
MAHIIKCKKQDLPIWKKIQIREAEPGGKRLVQEADSGEQEDVEWFH